MMLQENIIQEKEDVHGRLDKEAATVNTEITES